MANAQPEHALLYKHNISCENQLEIDPAKEMSYRCLCKDKKDEAIRPESHKNHRHR